LYYEGNLAYKNKFINEKLFKEKTLIQYNVCLHTIMKNNLLDI